MNTTELEVRNVTCGHCTATIQRELGELDGVVSVEANTDGRVRVEHDERTDRSAIEALLTEINYPPAG